MHALCVIPTSRDSSGLPKCSRSSDKRVHHSPRRFRQHTPPAGSTLHLRLICKGHSLIACHDLNLLLSTELAQQLLHKLGSLLQLCSLQQASVIGGHGSIEQILSRTIYTALAYNQWNNTDPQRQECNRAPKLGRLNCSNPHPAVAAEAQQLLATVSSSPAS